KEKELALVLHLLDLPQNIVDWSARLGGIKDGLNGAELALEMTTPAGFHQSNRQIALAAKDRAVRLHSGKRRPPLLSIELLQPPGTRIVDDARPERLGLADDDRL